MDGQVTSCSARWESLGLEGDGWCHMRVNASTAACLVGVSDKTMGNWLKKHAVEWGAQKVRKLGRPEEWEIELVDLYRATAGLIDPDHIRLLAIWIDLVRGTGGANGAGGTSSAPDGNGEGGSVPPSPTSTSPARTRTSREPLGFVPGRFRSQIDARRWLVRHGIRSASTPKDWRGWPPEPLDPENVLRLAQEIQQAGGFRVTWRLHECVDDPGCVCHQIL
jgi:hypothetical protein